MYRLNSTGRDTVYAALLLLTGLGIGLPAWGASPQVDIAIGDFSVAEDSVDTNIDLSA
jgi:hypothetical protein